MKKTKVTITERQANQFNYMLAILKMISKDYQTPAQLRKNSEKEYGLDYEESLEMAYENIQGEAAFAAKGVKPIPVMITEAGKEAVKWQPIDRPWSEYPIGTKAKSIEGGHWIKTDRGWKWFCGDTFPTPGADAIKVCLPEQEARIL